MDRSTFESADPIIDEMGRSGHFTSFSNSFEQAAILLRMSKTPMNIGKNENQSMNAYDFHTAAHRIAARLKDEGRPDWGTKIRDVMEYSATGTEILMKLRWTIQQFLKEAATCQPETLHMMQELLQKTDSLVK